MFFLQSQSVTTKILIYICAFGACTLHAQLTTAVDVVIGANIVVNGASGSAASGSKFSVTSSTGLAPEGTSGYTGPDFYYGVEMEGPAPQTSGLYQYNTYGLQAQTGTDTTQVATYFYTETNNSNPGHVYALSGAGASVKAYITGGEDCTFDARFMVLNKNQDGSTSYYLSSDSKSLTTSGINKSSDQFDLNLASTFWHEYTPSDDLDRSFFYDSNATQVAASHLNNIVGVGIYFEDLNTSDQGDAVNTKQMILNALEVDLMSIAIPELQSFSLVSGLLVFVGIMSRRRSFL